MSTAVDDEPVIQCGRVTKRFGAVVALDELDFSVRRGAVVGYLGPNGAGKSTTIRILVDLARADSGDVRLFGRDPRSAGPALRRSIGYLPGELRLDDRLTVDETIRSWVALRGGDVDPTYVSELCERLDLDRSRRNRHLSSGNRRKVGLVGALMARPELLILDEPTSGVDPLVQAEFHALVGEARDAGRTVFLSSHVLSEVQRVADDVIVIRSGKVVASGALEELRHQASQPFSVWFAGAAPRDDLAAVRGLSQVVVRDSEMHGLVTGDLHPLLEALARHEVTHVLFPEPDLEQAFLQYYEDDADGAGR